VTIYIKVGATYGTNAHTRFKASRVPLILFFKQIKYFFFFHLIDRYDFPNLNRWAMEFFQRKISPPASSMSLSPSMSNATLMLITNYAKRKGDKLVNEKLTSISSSSGSDTFLSNSKEELANGANNEFSNGYNIRFWELVIVIFVIVLWLASLYRFIRSFDMLRITHHREMPYKYKLREQQSSSGGGGGIVLSGSGSSSVGGNVPTSTTTTAAATSHSERKSLTLGHLHKNSFN